MQRIGVMGCGTVAMYGHLPALAATPGLAVSALYDPSPAQLAAAQAQCGAPHACTTVEEFFRADIDAVVITSPAPCHLQNITDAARAGKHILCEKPLGMSVEEVEAMIAVTEAAGVQLYTAFDYRFSPAAQRIRRLVAEGAIGEVRALRLVYLWNLHGKYATDADGRRVLNVRREGRMAEGGPLVDCGVHQIDLARWWLQSEAVRWSAAGAWIDDYAAPEHLFLHLDHACGAHTLVEISFAYGHTVAEPISHFTYQLIGTAGVIRYERETQLFEVRTPVGTERLPFAPEKHFAGMYTAFAAALATGASDALPTAYDGLMATRISREATEHAMRERIIAQLV